MQLERASLHLSCSADIFEKASAAEREREREIRKAHVVRDNISGHLRELVANIGFERTTFILFLVMFVLFYSLSSYS